MRFFSFHFLLVIPFVYFVYSVVNLFVRVSE
jgi:hypothetical protein